MTYTATGAPGSTIEQQVHGTSYADWGLTFANTVQVVIIFPVNIDVTSLCYPVAPNPVLATTVIV